MADLSPLLPLEQQFAIVDPRTGLPTNYLMDYLAKRQGYLTEADQELATILARQIIAGAGLTGGGALGDGDVTLTADAQAILDLITTTQGSILYRGADDWAALAPGTSGQFLKTNGAGANPEWATPAGGGGGGVALIDYVEAAGGETSLDVTAIPGTYKDLIAVLSLNATVGGFINVTVNSDTSSIYDSLRHYGGAAAGSNRYTNQTHFTNLFQSISTANHFLAATIEFLEYARTDRVKSILSASQFADGTAIGYIVNGSGVWKSTSAITAVNAVLPSGTFNAGSTLAVYGRS